MSSIGWSSLTGKPSGLKLVNAGSIHDTDRSVPAAASSRKLEIRSWMISRGAESLLAVFRTAARASLLPHPRYFATWLFPIRAEPESSVGVA